eukprot:6187421-Pleurochrysis_carterae.AAC.1
MGHAYLAVCDMVKSLTVPRIKLESHAGQQSKRSFSSTYTEGLAMRECDITSLNKLHTWMLDC